VRKCYVSIEGLGLWAGLVLITTDWLASPSLDEKWYEEGKEIG